MGLNISFLARHRRLTGCTAAAVIATAFVGEASCAHLTADPNAVALFTRDAGPSTDVTPLDKVMDGGPPAAVAKVACSDSTEQLPHTPGVGLDISSARGYTADPSIKKAAIGLLASGTNPLASRANQMRGTPPLDGTGAHQFNDIYRTLDDPTTGIKGVLFRDGPRGVNLEAPTYLQAFDVNPVAFKTATPYATTFPVTVAHAATWDLDLEQQIGEDLADEVLASGNTMSISPCVNILRHPAWGRSQETYGEDMFAIGRMGTAYTEGVQQYIPACVKHFAANNIELQRANQNAAIDPQTLREIYGRHFEMIVQDGGVACVMASYNKINGTKNTENAILLTDILRNTFGFKGFIMSDFWAMTNAQDTSQLSPVYAAVGTNAINAGLDMEMPWSLNYANVESLATEQQLTDAALHIIQQKLRFNVADTSLPSEQLGLRAPTSSRGPYGVTNNDSHLADAERAAEEAMVLLKNDKNTLPIPRDGSVKTIAVIGAAVPWVLAGTAQRGTVNFATDARVGDLGSSRVAPDPAKTVGPAAGIAAAAGGAINVVSGTDPNLADTADFVVVVAGMSPSDEGEEYTGAADRTTTSLGSTPSFSLDPKSGGTLQNNLISAVAAKGKPMVVVLEGGSAINMPWIANVPAVVMAWYPGQQGGTALGNLLFAIPQTRGGVTVPSNFSGKLPITWPKSEADEPVFNSGGSGGTTTMGFYLGYRYFDKNNTPPLFAYGSGLSYTTFKYTFLGVPCSTVTKKGVIDVQVQVTNTGTLPGNEVSFLFVSYPNSATRIVADDLTNTGKDHLSVKELKGFHRTTSPIMPGQTVQFTIPLRIQDLKYWDTQSNPPAWTVESGSVKIMVGPSSDNLPLQDTVTVE